MTRLNIGGPSRHIRILMNQLDPDRFDQRLVAGTVGAGELEDEQCSPLVHHRVESLGRSLNPLADFSTASQLRAVIREFRPHIVHTHQAKAGILARRAAHQENVPAIIHTFHGHTFEGYWRWPMQSFVVSAEKKAASRSSKIIVQSDSQQADIKRFLEFESDEKLVIVPPAIDMESLRRTPTKPSQLRANLGLTRERVVVFLGRLAAIKNPTSFLRVVQRLSELMDEPFAALIVGGGTTGVEQELQDCVDELNIRPLVRWLGYRRDVASILNLADVVVSTSINEGTPLSLIEALFCGARVAAFDVGGIADTLGQFEGVRIVEPGDEEDLAMAAKELLGLGRHEGRGFEEQRDQLEACYGPARLVEDIARLYESLVVVER